MRLTDLLQIRVNRILGGCSAPINNTKLTKELCLWALEHLPPQTLYEIIIACRKTQEPRPSKSNKLIDIIGRDS